MGPTENEPHVHANCVHIETSRGHGRTALPIALAAMAAGPQVLIVDEAPTVPPCCDGHSLCAAHQEAKDAAGGRMGIRRRAAKRRGLGLLALMVGLGAKTPPAPVPPCPTCGKARASVTHCLGCGGGLE